MKSDDSSIYYICGGTLYVVSKDNMAVKQEITTENPPFEMYVRGNSLVLVSEEKASGDKSEDGRDHTNVVIDIYTISSDSLTHIKTYKQNGEYNSARIDDNGVLYLVTGYSNYRGAPLDENADLDNYVPGYYIDGEKHYVAAEDITVPQGANNTDYTIISSVKCSEPVNISVKAVLGSNANAFCSDDTLYVAFRALRTASPTQLLPPLQFPKAVFPTKLRELLRASLSAGTAWQRARAVSGLPAAALTKTEWQLPISTRLTAHLQ